MNQPSFQDSASCCNQKPSRKRLGYFQSSALRTLQFERRQFHATNEFTNKGGALPALLFVPTALTTIAESFMAGNYSNKIDALLEL